MNNTLNKMKETVSDFWTYHGNEVLTYAGIFVISFAATRIGYIAGYNAGAANGVITATKGLMDKIPTT